MAEVKCKKCGRTFDASNHLVTGGAAAAGGAAGAWLGSGVGLALGPLGAIVGTIPGAIVGAALTGLGVSKVAKCPKCGKVMMV